jgi:hypothetical protein
MARPTTRLLVVLLAGAMLALTACGGKKSAATTTAAEPVTTAAAETGATTAAAGTEQAATTTSSSASAAGPAKDCKDFQNLSSELSRAFSGTGAGNLGDYKAELDALAKRAPEAVRPDFKVLADLYKKIIDQLGSDFHPGEKPDAATVAKLVQIAQSVDQAALTKATTHIANWIADNCSSSGG